MPFLGREGLFNGALMGAGLIDRPLDVLLFSDFAVVLAFVHLYALFMVVPVFNTMVRIDRRLIEAAVDAGAGPWAVLREVILPLSKPGIAIGSVFIITLVMGDFTTVRLMGGGQRASVGLEPDRALAVSRGLRQRRGVALARAADDHGFAARRRYQAGIVITRLGRWLLGGFFVLFVLFLYGPTLTIVVLSFQGPEGGLTFPMRGVSTAWFTQLFRQQAVGDLGTAFTRSLILATMVMAATAVVSVAAAVAGDSAARARCSH